MSAARRLYLYSASLVGLLAFLASLLLLSNEAIRMWSSGVFTARILSALAGRETIGWLGLGLVGVSIWAVHWFPANAAARQVTLTGTTERASSVRKAYLYIAQLVALTVGLVEAALGVADVLRRVLGPSAADGLAPWPEWALSRGAGVLIALIFWGHLRWVTVHDGDFGHEAGRAANWRRAYLYAAALVGFGLVIAGAIGYLRAMLGLAGNAVAAVVGSRVAPIPATGAWRDPLVWAVTALVVGIPLAITAWSTASRLAADAPQVEHSALSRVGLLHAGLLFGTAATLVSTAYLLQRSLLELTGGGAGTLVGSWSTVTLALACLPVGIVSWLAFAGSARNTAALAGEHTPAAGAGLRPAESAGLRRAAALRRSVFYLIAGSALAASWLGLTELLQLILVSAVRTVPAGIAPATGLQERFSLGAALVLVGAPAWWGYWWPRQTRARENGPVGVEERSSVARGLYLYGVMVCAAMVLLFSLGTIVLQSSGRRTADTLLSAATVGSVAVAAVALFWFVAHALVLRGDKRWPAIGTAVEDLQPTVSRPLAAASLSMARDQGAALPSAEAGEPVAASDGSPTATRTFQREELAALAVSSLALAGNPRRPVVVIDGGGGSLGAALLVALHSALPDVSVLPVGLNPVAQAAMSAALGDAVSSAVPQDLLSQAAVILGPGDILFSGSLEGEVSPELVEALRTSSARLLLLPPRDPRLRWVAAPDWPDERWIQNAVIEVGNVV